MDMIASLSPNGFALIGSSLLLGVMGAYTWRRRFMPAAIPILLMLVLRGFWILLKLFELFSPQYEIKFAWYHLSAALLPLMAGTASTVIIDFASPKSWLQKRYLALWLLPSAAAALFIITNPVHGWAFSTYRLNEFIQASRTPLLWAYVIYVLVLISALSWRMARMAVRWPVFRWPVLAIITAWISGLAFDYAGTTGTTVFRYVDANIIGFNITAFLFVWVVIAMRRMLDILPVARTMALERISDGALVIDDGGKVVYQNPIAQIVLDSSWSPLADHAENEAPTLADLAEKAAKQPVEIRIHDSKDLKQYVVRSSRLEDPRGWQLGTLLIFHDESDRLRARQLMLAQQRTQAVLEERDRIAGELHDDLGQVLGYVKLQIQAAQDMIAGDDPAAASQLLAQLLAVSQEAHTDVREYILGARTAVMLERGFPPVVEEYLAGVQRNFGLQTRFCLSSDWKEENVPIHHAVQLLRIIQEAVTNIRKHARASQVVVDLTLRDNQGCLVIQDDGEGFPLDRLAERRGMSFGIDFMHRRAEGMGAKLAIQSAPGAGTRVSVQFPLHRSQA
jgi:signal transduction histidine kinase